MMLYFTPELHYSRGNRYGLMVHLSFAFAADCSVCVCGGLNICLPIYMCVYLYVCL